MNPRDALVSNPRSQIRSLRGPLRKYLQVRCFLVCGWTGTRLFGYDVENVALARSEALLRPW
jgi:hypothetical protein